MAEYQYFGHSAVWSSKNLKHHVKHHAFCQRCNVLAMLLKNIDVNVFNDVLQNTKLHANNANCQTLVGVMMDLVMEKSFFWKLWKEQSWKLEVVVCNVNKKENIYKGFEVDEKLRTTFALTPQNS